MSAVMQTEARAAERLGLVTAVTVTVQENMRVYVSPHEVGRAGENDSAVFTITQPQDFDVYVCRAEIRTNAGTTYRLVTNKMFNLTSEIAVAGHCYLQLVYSDAGGLLTRKTNIAPFYISQSLNAVDPEAPGYVDGLAQLQAAAFAEAQVSGTTLSFSNISGNEVDRVTLPADGGGITEPEADARYVRQSGGVMTGPINALGLPPPQDFHLVTKEWVDGAIAAVPPPDMSAYLERSGGAMLGPLITATGGSLTNPGLGIGDNATGFYRGTGGYLVCSVGGSMAFQINPVGPDMMMAATFNMAGGRIQNVGAATVGTDAVSRNYADSRYLQLSGGQVVGPLTLYAPVQTEYDAINRGYADAHYVVKGEDPGSGVGPWLDFPMDPGFQSSTLRYRLIDGANIQFDGTVTLPSELGANTAFQLGAFPAGARPGRAIHSAIITQGQNALGANAAADLEVQVNGTVQVRSFAAVMIVYVNVMIAMG
jgi:hypothetical protein